jgi:hypothetical protein
MTNTHTDEKYYTGVGSRKTPVFIQKLMQQLGYILEQQNWILRSGGAKGADSAFDKLVQDKSRTEIFLIKQNPAIPHGIYAHPKWSEAQAIMIKNKIHPYFNTMQPFAKALHTRNVFQVLGHNLDRPANMLICWTPNGEKTTDECTIETGGTATAIKLANLFNVPVFNLAYKPDYDRINKFIQDNIHLIPPELLQKRALYKRPIY